MHETDAGAYAQAARLRTRPRAAVSWALMRDGARVCQSENRLAAGVSAVPICQLDAS